MWKEIKTTLDIFWIFLSEYFFTKSINTFFIKLSEKNILYVKLFQMFASHYKYVDSQQNIFLDNAPFLEKDIDYNSENDNDNKLKIINSGMISLVYRLEGGNKVFKIKRKNIEQDLKDAINHFRFIIKICCYITTGGTLTQNYGQNVFSTNINKMGTI
jgi:hypothetical protein